MNSGSRTRTIGWLLAIVLAVAASYVATPSFDFTNYDDNIYVAGNRHLQGGLTVENVRWAFDANLLQASREAEYWQPVTNVSRLIDVTLFGLAPGGHHLQSSVLHAVNACLVFWLFFSLSRSSMFSGASALLFAVHPLNAEAVCWLAARKDLLLGTGSLLTLLAYVWFARGPSLSRYLIALLAYLFALMAKPSAIALPIGFLLLDAWPLGRFSESIRMFRSGDSRPSMVVMAEKAPFFLLALLTAALTYVGQLEVGGVRPPALPLLARLGEAALGYVQYLKLFIWPTGLNVLYPGGEGAPDFFVAAAAFSVLLAVTGLTWLLRRTTPTAMTGWLWFLLLLSPLMGLVPFGRQSVADRYMYIPELGLIALVVAVGASALHFVPVARRRWAIAIASLAACSSLMWITHGQAGTWRDSIALWTQAVVVDPGNGVAHTNLGDAYSHVGDRARAGFELRLAVKSQPDSAEIGQQFATYLVRQKHFAEAIPMLERLIQTNPANMKLHSYLTTALEASGRPDGARRARARQEAIRGRIFLLQGIDYLENAEWAAAREQISLAWSSADTVEIGMGQRVPLAAAAQWADRAEVALNQKDGPPPATAAALRGLVFGLLGRWSDAEAAFAERVRLNPDDLDASWRQAVCLFRTGAVDLATQKYNEVLARRPDDAEMTKSWTAARGGGGNQ